MADLNKQFADIAALADHKLKTEKYKALLDQFIDKKAIKELQTFLIHSKLSSSLWMKYRELLLTPILSVG